MEQLTYIVKFSSSMVIKGELYVHIVNQAIPRDDLLLNHSSQ